MSEFGVKLFEIVKNLLDDLMDRQGGLTSFSVLFCYACNLIGEFITAKHGKIFLIA